MKGNWNTEFQKNFGNKNIESCKRFCKCKKECTGFNFNPKNGECSYKKDYPMNTYTNEAIEKTKQSCVIKGKLKIFSFNFCVNVYPGKLSIITFSS